MEYKHTTPKFVELIRRQTESAYSDNEPVKLSPVALLAYIEEFEEMNAELDYLRWFHENVDFGPAQTEVVQNYQKHYRIRTGKDVPADWIYE